MEISTEHVKSLAAGSPQPGGKLYHAHVRADIRCDRSLRCALLAINGPKLAIKEAALRLRAKYAANDFLLYAVTHVVSPRLEMTNHVDMQF